MASRQTGMAPEILDTHAKMRVCVCVLLLYVKCKGGPKEIRYKKQFQEIYLDEKIIFSY